MTRTKNYEDAKAITAEQGKLLGLCVHNGWYYIGTFEQLQNIGCIIERFLQSAEQSQR